MEFIVSSFSVREIKKQRYCIFYGGALNAHMSSKNITQIYKDGLDLIFGRI